jgi:hypothetical protein
MCAIRHVIDAIFCRAPFRARVIYVESGSQGRALVLSCRAPLGNLAHVGTDAQESEEGSTEAISNGS